MSKAPEFVVTGMTVPSVRFWARVLVRPHRLQDVKQSIIWHGRAVLQPGELLQIDTDPGDGIERAVTVGDPDAKRPWGHCIVAWNEIADVTVYGDDGDHLAAITEPVVDALVDRNPRELITKEIWLHSDRIDSIHVGGVHVHFDRDGDRKKVGPIDEVDEGTGRASRTRTSPARARSRSPTRTSSC